MRTTSAAETRQIGERLGAVAREGDVICLFGELGAGKTTLAQGIARGLGIVRRVTSPTFTLVQEYKGRLRLYHLDCYRLDGPEDLDPLGAADWIGRDGVTVIEWPERVAAALPDDRLEIRLAIAGEAHSLEPHAAGPQSARLAREAGLPSSACSTGDTEGNESTG